MKPHVKLEDIKSIEIDADKPTPQERAELAEEQEYIANEIQSAIETLNVYFVHAAKVGVFVALKEDMVEVIGKEPQVVLSITRSVAKVGFRKEKKS